MNKYTHDDKPEKFSNKLESNLMHDAAADYYDGNDDRNDSDVKQISQSHDRPSVDLLNSEQIYQRLIENSLDAIFIIVDRRIVFANSRIESMTDYTLPQLLKIKDMFSLIIKEDRAIVSNHFKNISSTNHRQCEFRIRTKHSGIKWIETNAIEIDFEGRKAFQITARDVTQKRIMEQQLMQAHKLESIDRLASGLAHDFNNLIGGITGVTLSIIEKMSKTNPYRKDIEYINQVAKEGAALVHDLLSFCRVGEDKSLNVNINDIITKVITLLSRTFTSDIDLHLNLCPTLSAIEADPIQLQQVILNICLNARDAMPEKGTLTITTTNLSIDHDQTIIALPAGNYIKIDIHDTGIGMDEDIQKRIFEPFFTTKEKQYGTGLGLAIVYCVIKRHYGHIEVESMLNQFTRFSIYLPVSSTSIQTKAPETTRIVDLDKDFITKFLKPAHKYRKGTIIIVDNDTHSRLSARDYLSSADFDVIFADSIEQLFSLIDSNGIDIKAAIIDEALLNPSAQELIHRRSFDKSHLPFLISLTEFDKEKIDFIESISNCNYVMKPFLSYDLIHRVKDSIIKK